MSGTLEMLVRRLSLTGSCLMVAMVAVGCGPGGGTGGQDVCEGETCVPAVCQDVDCERGVCEPETGKCVSAESCTVETQQQDCVSGEKCVDGMCAPKETYCDSITCDRGVCRFEAGGCTDAANCEGDDAKCLEGKFCNDMNRCRPDLCVENDVTCDRGVCEPSTGECENGSPCESSEECLADHLCVEGTCRLKGAACGDADGDGGCAGRKTCEHDEETLEAKCIEPENCETSFDCNDARQCSGRTCLEPSGCPDDRLEPNDTSEEATEFDDYAIGQAITAWVCQEDADQYTIDTRDMADNTELGQFLVELDVPQREQGLGEIQMTLVGPEGNEVGSTTTGAHGAEGHAELSVDVSVPDHGEYTVEISAGGDVKNPGVDYRLSTAFLTEETLQACESPEPIELGEPVVGSTEDASSGGLGSTCTTPRNASNEVIYALQVDRPRYIAAQVTPQDDRANLSIALRSDCTQIGTERACLDEGGEGDAETLETAVEPGTHYLVVQAPDSPYASGGDFELIVEPEDRPCAPGMAFCLEDGRSEFCSHDGVAYRQVSCDAGCDPSSGRCWPPAGNICSDGTTISPDQANPVSIDFRQFRDSYQMGGDSCLSGDGSKTQGPDRAYEVQVPVERAVTVEADFGKDRRGTMYLVEDCSTAEDTCRTSSADPTGKGQVQRLKYANLSDSDESLHLVVDTADNQRLSPVDLSVEYEEVVCSPGETQCQASNIVECGQYGTDWNPHLTCDLTCSSSTCQGDQCGTAVEIPADGQTYSYDIPFVRIEDRYNIDGASCMPSQDDDSPGKDAVFETTVSKNDVIDVSWDAYDPSLYIARDCNDLKATCKTGTQAELSDDASLEYKVDEAGTYYIMADVDEFQGAGGSNYQNSTFTARVRTPSCSPHQGLGCKTSDELVYCDHQGFEETYSCNAGCSSGACTPPEGQACADAIPITDDDTDSRDFSGRVTIPVSQGNYGNCSFDSDDTPESAEHIYEIDLQSGDELSVDWDSGIDKPGTSGGVMYLTGSCGDMTTCKTNGGPYARSGETDALTYTASSQETVYLVVARSSDYLADRYDYQVSVNVQ
jgi:hypothetical protein